MIAQHGIIELVRLFLALQHERVEICKRILKRMIAHERRQPQFERDRFACFNSAGVVARPLSCQSPPGSPRRDCYERRIRETHL